MLLQGSCCYRDGELPGNIPLLVLIALVYGIGHAFIGEDNCKEEILAAAAGDGIAFFPFPGGISSLPGQSAGISSF